MIYLEILLSSRSMRVETIC